MPIPNWLGTIFEPLAELIDSLHTSKEEKAEAQLKLAQAHHSFLSQLIEHEQQLIAEQAAIIRAEAGSEHALTSLWRPITMLFFVVVIGFAVFAGGVSPFTSRPIPAEYIVESLAIVKLGLGGYVIGRSAEKIVREYKGDA